MAAPEMPDPAETHHSPPRRPFSLGRSLILLLLVGVLPALIAVGYIQGWDAAVMTMFRPKLVPARGHVVFNGQPMTTGTVVTRFSKEGVPGSIGRIDGEGNVTLETEGDSGLIPGAYVGEHTVAIQAYGASVGRSPPPPLVPSEYVNLMTTPLKVEIRAGQDFTISFDGQVPERPSRPPGGGFGGGGPPGGGPPGGGAADAPRDSRPRGRRPPAETAPPAVDAPATDTPAADSSSAGTPAAAPPEAGAPVPAETTSEPAAGEAPSETPPADASGASK